ncbi:MAG: hypothetical protein ABIQ55_11720 [Gemmatimonadaceae bacterium]
MAAKKSTAKKSTAKKSTSKRTLIAPNGDKRYIKRNAKGQITESDDQGRSLSADSRKKAKKTVKAGYGDKGDQKRKG